MEKLLTDSKCPNCGSEQIEGDSPVIDNGEVRQVCWCTDCEANWTAVYVLVEIAMDT